jgi:uncharacterized membrane protein YraQ (UPF0718 family)
MKADFHNGATESVPGEPSADTKSEDHRSHNLGGTASHEMPKTDWLLLVSGSLVALGILVHLFAPAGLPNPVRHFAHGVYEFSITIWWGVALGILTTGILGQVPRELIIGLLGRSGGLGGILRAVGAGVLLDVCSHGILLIGMRLYERGASLGQTMAFLVATPWNSLAIMLILSSLIGVFWTLAFMVLSVAIGILTGLVFEQLVARGMLPANPNRVNLPEHFDVKAEAQRAWQGVDWRRGLVIEVMRDGWKESQMILRWVLLGVVLGALLRAVLDPEAFQYWFGPTLFGLMVTLAAATLLEVCSEGSSPIAADILSRGNAPGNAFTFLMAGVATDYTEILSIRERTGSWKVALFLPLVTVPQVVVVGYLINVLGS